MDREQRVAWEDERRCRGLVPGHADFGRAGLMLHLDQPCVLVTTLPSDTLRPFLDFDHPGLVDIFPLQFKGQLANSVTHLNYLTTTSDALVRYALIGAGGWRGFVAARRDGGVDVGLGSVARFTYRDGSVVAAGTVGYKLFALTHALRVAVETQAALIAKVEPAGVGPIEIDVALPGAGGSVLTGFAEGWANPEHGSDDPVQCLEADPLVRLEVEEWPSAEDTHDLVFRSALRLCNSFGILEARFLPRQGVNSRIPTAYA